MNTDKLKLKILEEIQVSYTRAGFGRLLKSEIDLLMFDLLLKLYFLKYEDKEEYFIEEEINYFAITKQDIYGLSKELKCRESKIISSMEQIGLLKGLLEEKHALPNFMSILKMQKQDSLEDGKLKCYIPNKLVKNFIEAKIDAVGLQPDYAENRDIIKVDLSFLMDLYGFNSKKLEVYIAEQNKDFNNKDLKRIKSNLTKKDIDIQEVGKELLKAIGSKFFGKTTDQLIDNLFDHMGRGK